MVVGRKPSSGIRLAVATAALCLACCGSAGASTISAAAGSGSRVYFATDESLLPTDTDSAVDIYERQGGELSLLTIGDPACRPGCGNGNVDVNPSGGIHGTGDAVIFSTAESLTAADTDSSVDVYEHNDAGLELVSQGPNGFNGAFDATFFSANEDGSAVVFSSPEQLVGADTDAFVDVYVRAGGTTTLVSQGPAGFNGAFDAMPSANSDDESAVFLRTSERLVGADADSSVDLYERRGGTTALVSQGAEPYNGPFDVDPRVLVSSDGAHVLFSTAEPLAAPDEDTLTDAYLRSGGQTRMVSKGAYNTFTGDYPVQVEALDSSENRAIYSTKEVQTEEDRDASSVDIYQWLYGQISNGANPFAQTALVSTARDPFAPEPVDAEFLQFVPSTNATFFSTAEKAAAGDTDSSPDIYERDVSANTTRLVSQGSGGPGGNFTPSFQYASADGLRVFFTTAEQMVSEDKDNSVDLYERDGMATTVLRSPGEINGNGAFDVTPLGGIQRALFTTAEKLVPGDTDAEPDLYAEEDGRTSLISTAKPDPAAPVLAGITPQGPANANEPSLHGSAEAGSQVRIYSDVQCAGAPLAGGSAASFASPGLPVNLPDDSTTTLYADATDTNGNTGPCSTGLAYVEDSTALPPALIGTDPTGPANDNTPRVKGSAESGATVQLFTDPLCAGLPAATGSDAELAGAGIAVTVPDNLTTTLYGKVVDRAGNGSACSAGSPGYVEDSQAPDTTISGGPQTRTYEKRSIFTLGASEAATFTCRVDSRRPVPCGSPYRTPGLRFGKSHRILVTATDQAGNADPTPATRRFRVLKKPPRQRR